MSLLAGGRLYRQRAADLFRAGADIESREKQTRLGLEAAKDAQEMQTYGTAAGIGAMYGLKNSGGIFSGSQVSSSLPSGALIKTTGVPSGTVGLPQMSPLSGVELGSSAQLQGMGQATANALGASTTAPQMSLTPGATEAVANLAPATETVAVAGEAAAAGTAASGTASGVSGTMSSLASSLGSIAAPIGIALGVGYLLNKLFD
jgi:hypothetical protein